MSDFPTPDITAETKPLPLRPIEPQTLDIQHDTDPADDHGIARHVPHLGHALLFCFILVASLGVCYAVTFGLAHLHSAAEMLAHPGLGLIGQDAGYVLATGVSFWIFPLLWDRAFFSGLEWNFQMARRRWPWIVAAGLIVNVVAQVAIHFVGHTKDAPVDKLLANGHIIWLVAFSAVILGPMMEEMAFRGFLLPALAIAYDWLSLERTPAGLQRWQSSTSLSRAALIFSAIVSSVPFAVMHAAQIGYAWGVVGILYFVSLALSYVRIRTHSLACSALLHATYNFTIFGLLFVSTGGFRHMQKLGDFIPCLR
jgi:membrane protease YdiL (CAAX protease family)